MQHQVATYKIGTILSKYFPLIVVTWVTHLSLQCLLAALCAYPVTCLNLEHPRPALLSLLRSDPATDRPDLEGCMVWYGML